MKIWLVMMFYGHIVATVGPLPPDVDCFDVMAMKQREIAAKDFDSLPPLADGRRVALRDVSLGCLAATGEPMVAEP